MSLLALAQLKFVKNREGIFMKKNIVLCFCFLFLLGGHVQCQQLNRIQTEEQKLHYLIQTLGVCGKVQSFADEVCQCAKDYAVPLSIFSGVLSGLLLSSYVQPYIFSYKDKKEKPDLHNQDNGYIIADVAFSLIFFTFAYGLCRLLGSFAADNHLTDVERLELFFAHWPEHQDKIPQELKPFFEKMYLIYKESEGKILYNKQLVEDIFHALANYFIQESLFIEKIC
jgi:hypothetical protein